MQMLCASLLVLLLAVTATSAYGEADVDNSSLVLKFVHQYAPRLRFDSDAGTDEYCFPSSAEDYYDRRMKDDTSKICNLDYKTIQGGKVPTYYHAQVCNYHLYIAYWSFFGWNPNCDCCSGRRNAWFESLVVKVRDYNLPGAKMHSVRFSQKNGWYTRIPGNYETLPDGRPVAYVGKASHGFYHDDGGTGTCCYFEDYRNPSDKNQYQDTWLNLVAFNNQTRWMNDNSSQPWSGILQPQARPDLDLCKLNSCAGADVQLCGKSGCHKSDMGDGPF